MESILEWWPLAAGGLAWLMGHTTARVSVAHRLDSVERRMMKAEDDIEVLQNSGNDAAVNLGIIQTTLTQIKESLDRLHEDKRSRPDR